MSEKWLVSRCEGYAVHIDEGRVTRLKHRRADPRSTPPNEVGWRHKENTAPIVRLIKRGFQGQRP